jgi:methylenetetrahydrofolate dehydrogenase (NADP+)/methenyltetrahydrofolate cyclohydrolase/formyltetrahydrofolate synthetase
MLGC